MLLDKAQRREFRDLFAIEGGLEIEVKVGQRPVDRIAGESEPTTLLPRLGRLHLDLQESLQHLAR